MKQIDKLFMQLMRVALGAEQRLEMTPSAEEWEAVMMTAAKQSVGGVAFCGVEKLPAEQRPPIEVLMDWSALVDYCEKENVKLNEMCVKVCRICKNEGINACVLKGQGMAALYDQPLRRSSGDIDLWMEGGKEKVVSYIRKNFPKTEGGSDGHHIAVTVKGGIDMEVHYVPGELFNPFHQKAMFKWFDDVEKKQWNNVLESPCINVPTKQFDVFFILSHMFMHWAVDGCGMKQMVDYYYLVKFVRQNNIDVSEPMSKLKEYGMLPFASALMYIFAEYLGMDDALLLCRPNKRLGETLLTDILRVGTVTTEQLKNENVVLKFTRRWLRMWRIFPLAPSEIVWLLPNNLYVWCRRMMNNKKGE